MDYKQANYCMKRKCKFCPISTECELLNKQVEQLTALGVIKSEKNDSLHLVAVKQKKVT